MISFSDRLRAERTRLGFSQTDFGALGGVGREAQLNYEKGVRIPDANYLIALMPHGVDVHFLLTGEPVALAGRSLSLDEQRLLSAFEKMNSGGRVVALAVVDSLAQTSSV